MPTFAELFRSLPCYRPEAGMIREPHLFALYLLHLALICLIFLHPAVESAAGVGFPVVAGIAGVHVGVMTFRILLDFRGYGPTLVGPVMWLALSLVEPAAATLVWVFYCLEAGQDGLLVRPNAWHAALLFVTPAAGLAAAGALGLPHAGAGDTLLAGGVGFFTYAWVSLAIAGYHGNLDLARRREAERIRNDLREHIAADLHDGLGATFTGMALRCRVAAAAPPAEARAMVEEVLGMTQAVLRRIRLLAKTFGPDQVTRDELDGMLRELLAETAPGLALFAVEGEVPQTIDREFVYQLLHLVGEATANAVRHGRATRIGVHLVWQGTTWQLSVDDDGAGISADAAASLETASPLASRARRMGARLRVAGSPAGGVRVEFTNRETELAA